MSGQLVVVSGALFLCVCPSGERFLQRKLCISIIPGEGVYVITLASL